MQESQLLLLLIVANGAPILIQWLVGFTTAKPIDAGLFLPDGERLFGKNKTLRGLGSALIVTTLIGLLFGFSWQIGALIAAFAMLGDLLSSFIKRRLALPSGSQVFGLDQIPESLLPLLICQSVLDLAWPDVVLLVMLFILADQLLSRWLYQLNIRRRPY
jgi:CDP-diglyceride synthetase